MEWAKTRSQGARDFVEQLDQKARAATVRS
jgi:hypothetical protein